MDWGGCPIKFRIWGGMDLDPGSWGGLELGLKIGPVKTSTLDLKLANKFDATQASRTTSPVSEDI